MQCPACKTEILVMTERQGIEIDYCPSCRGVWLDRGELDKLIERSAAQLEAPPAQRPAPMAQAYPPPQRGYQDDRKHHYPQQGYPHKKKKGLLGELFDFD
ncbi:MAG TPA: zf-TFIIB domain-containing protein [Xanthomonadaceae bacterium]|nr:zf-TFIIB domain-containing protein [Xanthomonadaceae bacterium]